MKSNASKVKRNFFFSRAHELLRYNFARCVSNFFFHFFQNIFSAFAVCLSAVHWSALNLHNTLFLFSIAPCEYMQCTFSRVNLFSVIITIIVVILFAIFTFIVDCLMHWRYEIATLVTANCLGARRVHLCLHNSVFCSNHRYEKAKRT